MPEVQKGGEAGGEGIKIIAKNPKTYHGYFVEDKLEAGIQLAGTEVKSIRLGHVNLKDGYALVPLPLYFRRAP